MANRMGVTVNGPQHELWPDHTNLYSQGGEAVVARGRAFAYGEVGMRAIDGIHTATGLDYTKDYDDVAAGTIDWNRNLFLPEISTEEGGSQDVYVWTKGAAQDKEGRAVRYGLVYVKCNLASTTVTAGMKFKLTDAQIYLSPAQAGSSGAARIVFRASIRQTFSAIGVQLVLGQFVGSGAGHGVRFT